MSLTSTDVRFCETWAARLRECCVRDCSLLFGKANAYIRHESTQAFSEMCHILVWGDSERVHSGNIPIAANRYGWRNTQLRSLSALQVRIFKIMQPAGASSCRTLVDGILWPWQ